MYSGMSCALMHANSNESYSRSSVSVRECHLAFGPCVVFRSEAKPLPKHLTQGVVVVRAG